MNLLPRFAAPSVLLAIVSLAAPSAVADVSANTARDLVTKVTGEGIAILRDKSLSKDQKNERIQKIAADNMDFETVSRLCLGRHWKTLSESKRAEFMEEFKKRLIISYTHNTDEYTDQDVTIATSRQEADGDFTVETHVVGTNEGAKKELAKVNYRLRAKNDQLKVIDITIEGVSLVSNYRSQFQDIMTNGGIDKLLKLLRDKNARNEK